MENEGEPILQTNTLQILGDIIQILYKYFTNTLQIFYKCNLSMRVHFNWEWWENTGIWTHGRDVKDEISDKKYDKTRMWEIWAKNDKCVKNMKEIM